MEPSRPAVAASMAPGGASSSPAAGEQKLHFLDYWRIIRIRKLIILAVFLLVVTVVTAVTFALTPRYASTTRIQVQKDVFDLDVLRASGSDNDMVFFNTQISLLKSRELLEDVIQQLKLNDVYAKRERVPEISVEVAFDILNGNVEATPDRNTQLVNLTVFDSDPVLAADIAARIAKVYIDFRSTQRTQKESSGLASLREQYKVRQAEVAAMQTNVDRLRVELKIPMDMADGAFPVMTMVANQIARLDADRTASKVNYERLKSTLTNLRLVPEKNLPNELQAASPGQELGTLISQYNQAELRRSTLSPDLGLEHPDVKKVMLALATLKEQIKNQVDGIMGGLELKMKSEADAIATIEAQTEALRRQQSDEINKYQPFVKARRELLNLERMRDLLSMTIMQEEVGAKMGSGRSVRVTDRAIAGRSPVRPRKVLNIALGSIFGLLLGVGLAFFIEYLDTSVKTIDDVEHALGTAVLGVIPQNVSPLYKEGPDSPHAEAYRVLRTNILFSRKDPNARTMTVVSGGAGEGKSTTIFNLATVFAQNGARVLIVDSDLRRPSLHKILGVSNAMGLTNFLLKQNTLEEVVQTTPVPGLDFLPSGKLPSSSVGVLNSVAMREFVKDIRSRYDFVFFDSPPIMGVSDASILAAEVDMAVLVVQYRKYPQQMTLRAKQMVEKIGGKDRLLGVVLNNINISQDSYYYYYSGYYYDYYSKSPDSQTDSDKGIAKAKESSSGKASVDLKRKY